MTEEEWLTSEDPFALIGAVDPVSQRKGKLFVVGCCRQAQTVFQNRLNRKAILAIESNADGEITDEELHACRGSGKWGYKLAATCSAKPPTPMFVIVTNHLFEDRTIQCSLLRDLFNNPFRPVAFDPNWRTSDVVSIARAMYESRDFSPMPILADALQDAGCEHADILDHCRGTGPHVRGCWVVDLVLGKA